MLPSQYTIYKNMYLDNIAVICVSVVWILLHKQQTVEALQKGCTPSEEIWSYVFTLGKTTELKE